ncbi:hypothetical protein [Nocardia sp. NPDC003963]
MSEYFLLSEVHGPEADQLCYRHFHTSVDGREATILEDGPRPTETSKVLEHALGFPADALGGSPVDIRVELAVGALVFPVQVRARLCTLPSCLAYCDDAECRAMVPAVREPEPGDRCPQCRNSELVPWNECGWLDVAHDQRWSYDYEQIVACIYRDEQREVRIGEYHGRVIAGAWANPHDYPELYRWVDGATDCAPETLRAEAEKLGGSLRGCKDRWKEVGRPDPQIAAAYALENYLTDLANPPA